MKFLLILPGILHFISLTCSGNLFRMTFSLWGKVGNEAARFSLIVFSRKNLENAPLHSIFTT
jgi:hypothetical protein